MAIRPAADPVVEVDLAGQGVGGDVRGGIAGVDGLASSPVERSCDPGHMGSCVARLSGILTSGGSASDRYQTGVPGGRCKRIAVMPT